MQKRNSGSADAFAEADGLINKRRLAEAVSLSTRSIENLVRQRKIPVVRISPRCTRFHLPSVISALRRFEVIEATR